jgi:hypothetical protein
MIRWLGPVQGQLGNKSAPWAGQGGHLDRLEQSIEPVGADKMTTPPSFWELRRLVD